MSPSDCGSDRSTRKTWSPPRLSSPKPIAVRLTMPHATVASATFVAAAVSRVALIICHVALANVSGQRPKRDAAARRQRHKSDQTSGRVRRLGSSVHGNRTQIVGVHTRGGGHSMSFSDHWKNGVLPDLESRYLLRRVGAAPADRTSARLLPVKLPKSSPGNPSRQAN
jgi:hypothetical protein